MPFAPAWRHLHYFSVGLPSVSYFEFKRCYHRLSKFKLIFKYQSLYTPLSNGLGIIDTPTYTIQRMPITGLLFFYFMKLPPNFPSFAIPSSSFSNLILELLLTVPILSHVQGYPSDTGCHRYQLHLETPVAASFAFGIPTMPFLNEMRIVTIFFSLHWVLFFTRGVPFLQYITPPFLRRMPIFCYNSASTLFYHLSPHMHTIYLFH